MFNPKFPQLDLRNIASTLFLTITLSATVILVNFLSLSLAAEVLFSITFFAVMKSIVNEFNIYTGGNLGI